MKDEYPLYWPGSQPETVNLSQLHSRNLNSKQDYLEEPQSQQKINSEVDNLRLLYDSLPCICFTLSSTGFIHSISRFGAAFLGYEGSELTQNFVGEFFYREDKVTCQAKLTELHQPNQTIQWESRLVCKNGNIIWVKAIARLVCPTESHPLIVLVCEDITKSKQIEETLGKSEELHRSTLSNISDTVLITNNQGAFTYICPNVSVFFGYSWQEIQEMGNVTQLLGENLFDPQVLDTLGEIRHIEREVTDKTGQLHTLLVNVKRVPIQDGIVLYSCRDITDLTTCKRTKEALRESEERFRVTFEQAAVGMTHIDLEGRFLRVNQKFCEIVGYKSEELLNQTFQEITFPDDLAANLNYLRSLLAGEIENYEMDKRYIRKDGAIVWGHQRISLVRDTTGEPKYFVAVIEDISDCRLAKAQLEHSLGELRWKEALLQSMTSASPLAFYVVDNRTDTIVYFNHRFCEIWGIEHLEPQMCRGEFKNAQLLPHCLPLLADTTAFVKSYKSLQRKQNRAVVEDEVALVDGRTLRFFSTQIRDKSDRYFGRLYLFEDVSDRKQAEETLQQQFLKERLMGAIAQRIHQSLNLEEILNTTVAEVRQFLACDRAIVFRLNRDGSGVVVVESVSSDWAPISGTIINDRYFADIYIQLYQQGRVQAVEDIYSAGLTQCHVNLLAQFQVRANLVVPIVHEERLWGLLVAQQCTETRQWQSLEIDLLKSLATQAAIAIQQSELYQQAQAEILQRQQAEEALRQQFQREQLIGAIAQRIRQSLNLEQILERTVTEVRQVLQTDRVIIFRFQPDWSGEVVVESVSAPWFSILGENIYDPCFEASYVVPYQQGRVRAIEDIDTANLNQCHIDLLTRFQVRANLVVPILHKDQLWGLLIAHHCSEPRQWHRCEIDLLTSLASQAAIAIQQSQLYEQAQSQAKREQAINQVTQAIRSSLDLNTIFSTAVREIGQLLQVDRVHILQYLRTQNLWVNVAESCKRGCSPVGLGLEIPDDNNEIAEQLKRLQVVRIENTQSFGNQINHEIARQFSGAWLLVPLHFGSSVWGTLGLVINVAPYHWRDSEIDLICEVADQLAIALQQAELYEQSRRATTTAITQARQLEQALQELQRTQAQLVQSEKMSSLGQLVAGVAHEINNPVNFIYGNLTHASGYTQDLLGLIELYQEQYPNPTPEISSEIEAIDLEFLIEDLPRLLDSMKIGAERISEIVRSLRNFSRVSEAEMKAVDIHEGIDSTLMILQNRLKAQGKHPAIQVIKKYGNLPKVECYAGPLNQVFMNLLTNAIDALEEAVSRENKDENKQLTSCFKPVIWIRTELLNNRQVAIWIADNGLGMTEQVRQRLFDPFFTTKPIGVGTGLGLSISYQIVVEKHGGQLLCFSELGQGTEFVIEIPLFQRSKPKLT